MSEVKLTKSDFLFYNEQILSIGYQEITKKDKSKDAIRLEFQAPRILRGSEVGHFYSHNEYTSKIWCSYLRNEEKFREVGKDSGWPIITQGDRLAYCARPLHRTKGFILKLLRYAWVNKWKIDNLPLCPCCTAQMVIYRKPGTRQYMFACTKTESHPDRRWRFLSWDYKLPPKAKAFVEIRRMYTVYYNKKNQEDDYVPTPAGILRKRWIILKPENVIENRFLPPAH